MTDRQMKQSKIKCDAEQIKYKQDDISFISKVFTTPNGGKGVWEYCNHQEDSVYLSVIAIAAKDNTFIVRKENQVCTHEK